MVRRTANVLGQLVLQKRAFLVIEPLDILGEVGEHEEPNEGHDAGQQTFEDENPPPTVVSPNPVHLADGAGEQTAEGAGQGGGAEEEAEPFLSFASLIPHAEQVETYLDRFSPFSPRTREGHLHPGNIPVSKTPKKKRVVISPPQFWTRPWQIMTNPNPNIQIDTVISISSFS